MTHAGFWAETSADKRPPVSTYDLKENTIITVQKNVVLTNVMVGERWRGEREGELVERRCSRTRFLASA